MKGRQFLRHVVIPAATIAVAAVLQHMALATQVTTGPFVYWYHSNNVSTDIYLSVDFHTPNANDCVVASGSSNYKVYDDASTNVTYDNNHPDAGDPTHSPYRHGAVYVISKSFVTQPDTTVQLLYDHGYTEGDFYDGASSTYVANSMSTQGITANDDMTSNSFDATQTDTTWQAETDARAAVTDVTPSPDWTYTVDGVGQLTGSGISISSIHDQHTFKVQASCP